MLLELGRSRVIELALQGPEGREYAHHAGEGHTGNLERATAFFRQVPCRTLTGKAQQSVLPACSLKIARGQELHLLEVPDFKPSPFQQEGCWHMPASVRRARLPTIKLKLPDHGAALVGLFRSTLFEWSDFRDPVSYFFEVIEKERGEQ